MKVHCLSKLKYFDYERNAQTIKISKTPPNQAETLKIWSIGIQWKIKDPISMLQGVQGALKT